MNLCLDYHKFISTKSQQESRVWLQTKLDAFCITQRGTTTIQHSVNGTSVCAAVFKQMYGISNNKYANTLKEAVMLTSLPIHGNIGNKNAEVFTAKVSM